MSQVAVERVQVVLLQRECLKVGAPSRLVQRLADRDDVGELRELRDRYWRWLMTSRPSYRHG